MRIPAFLLGFLILSSSIASMASAADDWGPFLGTWEYRQKNSASPTGFDAEGERLVIRRKKGALAGEYFGLERLGEHGLRYTAVPVAGLSVAGGEISFHVPTRPVFRKRPASLKAAEKMESTSQTKDRLEMKGRIVEGRLLLTCSSRLGTCPEKTLEFTADLSEKPE